MNIRFLAAGAFMLAGSCQALANDVHEVKCKTESELCIREAIRVCGTDYHVIDSESHAGGLISDAIAGPVTWYSMIFECPNSRGSKPTFVHRGNTYHVAPIQPVERTTRQRVSVGVMAKFCVGEASARFGRRPQEFATLPVERDGGGYVVYGEFPVDSPNVTTFECHFDSSGLFRRVARN